MITNLPVSNIKWIKNKKTASLCLLFNATKFLLIKMNKKNKKKQVQTFIWEKHMKATLCLLFTATKYLLSISSLRVL